MKIYSKAYFILSRIEEILEDLELPEYFHSRDIIERIDWLARSVKRNSLFMTDWDQKSSVEGHTLMLIMWLWMPGGMICRQARI